jgi:hypothetical protein
MNNTSQGGGIEGNAADDGLMVDQGSVRPLLCEMLPMDEKSKKEIKRVLDRAEQGITRSIIRWKYRKEGKPLPRDELIDDHSREVVDQAHGIIKKRGKAIWKELKKVYSGETGRKEDKSD